VKKTGWLDFPHHQWETTWIGRKRPRGKKGFPDNKTQGSINPFRSGKDQEFLLFSLSQKDYELVATPSAPGS
jgi:hypothetical protein